ncbi:MAG: glycosyltransferase [Bacteroidales bacterium]|nr:glycosyltransferase [Bacteroidales bacterium]
MKARIFIAMHYMEIGGAETALIGLLNALDPNRVDVDLFLYDHRGEMMQFIPEWVNLLPQIPKYSVLERPIVELVKRGFWGIAAARMWAKRISKVAYKRSGSKLENNGGLDKMSKCTTPLLPKINQSVTYDLAISFLTPHRIVAEKVKAKKKIAWIHTDYTRVWVDAEDELKVWQKYDYVASISGDVTNTFLQVFPSLAPKIVEIENILSPSFVRKRAELQDVDKEIRHEGAITLLSVGRFSDAKNYDNVPDICKRLIGKTKLNIKWYIIGYGGDEALIRKKIKEAGMEEHVILLGKRSNPYPYIKACDIYVQPSRYEGKSVTVREAQMLCKPVVVTNYPTAPSQIRSGIDGVIVPMDNEGCAHGLAEVICDKPLQERIIAHLKTHDYGNESEVEKIYTLINE